MLILLAIVIGYCACYLQDKKEFSSTLLSEKSDYFDLYRIELDKLENECLSLHEFIAENNETITKILRDKDYSHYYDIPGYNDYYKEDGPEMFRSICFYKKLEDWI